MTHPTNRRKGAATLEMTLIGIPIIFVLISLFEMARGMWIYQTLAYAVREGTRYTIVHGENCSNAPNSCTVTVAQIAAKIRDAGIGLDPTLLQVEMTSLAEVQADTLENLLKNGSQQFPTGGGAAVQAPITITVRYPFLSAISMFWPGNGNGMNFAGFTLPASSQEKIQF